MNKLILGTVQMGLDYGINNRTGKPQESESFRMLDLAKKNGIQMLDTAESYGNAIDIIGRYHNQTDERFEMISKFRFSPSVHLSKTLPAVLKGLSVNRLFAYLLHDPEQMADPKVETEFNNLKQRGIIKYSGVSVYTNEQFRKAIETEYLDIIQIPYNLLDNKSIRGALIKKAKDNNKIIHTRSVFLQGLFFMEEKSIPVKLRPLVKYINKIEEISKVNHITKESLAINYVTGNEMIDGVLVGADTAEQLSANIAASALPIPATVRSGIDNIKVDDTDLLNPAKWN